jgi:hypothetical protein
MRFVVRNLAELAEGDNDMRHSISSLLLIGALVGTVGCVASGRVRVYDEPYHDYHRWDSREDRVYRDYLREQHRDYREFRSLNKNEQGEYWTWRHAHPDRRS